MGARRLHKRYAIDQSPLYKLGNKRRLASILNTTLPELQKLVRRHDNYLKFEINPDSERLRPVETPKPRMERIHRRLFALLSRVEPPEYLHSGVKGRSYITNARAHTGARTMVKLDIVKFFPSTRRWHVYDFFRNILLCSSDVAGLLANICTVDDHLPTGSCVSQVLAFYAHKQMFDDINNTADNARLTMTCYVDDIAISGDNASGKTLHTVRTRIKQRGLNSHKKKEKIYPENRPKLITGVIVDGGALRLPNCKHREIYEGVLNVDNLEDPREKSGVLEKALHRSIAAAQIDPAFQRRVRHMKRLTTRLQKEMG